MDSFYNFASNNPILTFFLFSIAGECIVKCVKVVMNNVEIVKEEDES